MLVTYELFFKSHSEQSEESQLILRLRYFAPLNMTNLNFSEVSVSYSSSIVH